MRKDKRIKEARYWKNQIKSTLVNLEKSYSLGQLSYHEYFFKVSKYLKGKSEREWYNYYDRYVSDNKLKLVKPRQYVNWKDSTFIILFIYNIY